jgi:hypothetical protein
MVESVYSAERIDSLHNADCVSCLKGQVGTIAVPPVESWKEVIIREQLCLENKRCCCTEIN